MVVDNSKVAKMCWPVMESFSSNNFVPEIDETSPKSLFRGALWPQVEKKNEYLLVD